MKTNTTAEKTARPAVTVGATVCYRTKAGSYNRAVVKEIVTEELGEMAILSYTNKAGETVEFKKLLKNVWVYTGKKAAAKADKADAEDEFVKRASRPAVTVGATVGYRAASGKCNVATVKAIDNDMVTLSFSNKDGETVEFKKMLKNVWVYNGKKSAKAA